MRIRSLQIALLATLACLGLVGPGMGIAKEAESRESRDTREVRETRAARDLREAREREQRDADRSRRDSERSGSNSGSDTRSGSGADDDDDDGDDEDRGGSNSGSGGSDGQSGTRGSGRIEVERDARGGDRQRGEVLLVGSQENVAAVRNAGYTLLAERRLESLRRSMVRVRVRDGQSVDQLLESLRQLAPGARVAPNHIYNPSQLNSAALTRGSTAATPRARATADIGIIDTGADADNTRLRPLLLAHRGFAPGGYQARPHGTAVAQLAAGQGAKLAVADVFGVDARNHLVAPAELIAAAIDWMISQRIRVVNISIEGPYNAVLDLVVEDAISRGVAVVAAAGNGGPSSAPAYPAAYAGVVAVTALDERGQIYRRAARGEHLQFAARGSYGVNQQLVDTRVALAGTSFAAPVVAAEIARRWRNLPDATRESILAGMRADATDMGPPGHDAIYGWGRMASR